MQNGFNGLGIDLNNVARLSTAQSRSISPENFAGEKGAGGQALEGTGAEFAQGLGQGWKISPCVNIGSESCIEIANIVGPGCIQHMWLTVDPAYWRSLILRFYWDGEETPSIEVPIGDFFCNGWCTRCNVNSLPVAVNPAGGFNSYWQMPFRQKARVTIENVSPDEVKGLYYQVDYVLTEIPEDFAYLHAQWRRNNPLQYQQVHTLVDNVVGKGQYVGTYIAWGVNNSNWWGEGEVKFYLDDDIWPTICGTGTEDYFGGAWNFEHPKGEYGIYSTPFLGLPQVIKPNGLYQSQQRFGMYRWHIPDPIRFERNLRITIQALGWRSSPNGVRRYLPLQDDVASTAFWYQTEPHMEFPKLPDSDYLQVI